MAYFHIEQIHERKGEKVAFMLTAENMAGLVVGVLPLYLLTGSLPFWLRAILLGLAGVLGVVATLDMGGLTPIERGIWMVRGVIRLRFQGSRLTPEQLPGAAPLRREERALRANGPIQVLPTRAVATIRGVAAWRVAGGASTPLHSNAAIAAPVMDTPLAEIEA